MSNANKGKKILLLSASVLVLLVFSISIFLYITNPRKNPDNKKLSLTTQANQIFGTEPPPKAEESRYQNMSLNPPQLKLKGIFTDPAKGSSALIENDRKESAHYYPGDMVENGWVLNSIDAGSVVLAKKSDKTILPYQDELVGVSAARNPVVEKTNSRAKQIQRFDMSNRPSTSLKDKFIEAELKKRGAQTVTAPEQ